MKNRVIATLAAVTFGFVAGCTAANPQAGVNSDDDAGQVANEASDAPTVAPASESPSESPRSAPSPTPNPTPTSQPSELTIVSGGDILLHLSANEAARIEGETYDFSPYYSDIEDWISGADLAICALEVPIVYPDQMPSNYPAFGAPWDLAKSLAKVGYDGCAVATNHTMDRGFGAVTSTIDALTDAGMGWSGSARSAEEADQIQFYDYVTGARDVRIAHISATTLTNGIPIPADHPYSWNVVGDLGAPVEAVIDDAKKARELGADLVVVSMHWGTEYVSEPIEEQTQIAQMLAESGEVDLVFGNHSHVPEPVTEIEGGPRGEGMWVVWSMGNQVSGQTVQNHGFRVTTGLLTTATVSVPAEGPATVEKLEWTALTQDRPAGEKLYVLSELVEGDYPEGMTLSKQEIQARADVTYPVMTTSGEERREAPVPQANEPEVTRE